MEGLIAIAMVFVLLIAITILIVLAAGIAVVVCMTLYALVKPHISHLIDAWIDWVERRTGC